MTAPKPGDRVRIEYEAEYSAGATSGHLVNVGDGELWAVPVDATLTVLPKPLRVGDKVRLGEGPEPPVGTVLLTEGSGCPYRRVNDGVWTLGTACSDTYSWARFEGDGDATVVWLPEVAS